MNADSLSFIKLDKEYVREMVSMPIISFSLFVGLATACAQGPKKEATQRPADLSNVPNFKPPCSQVDAFGAWNHHLMFSMG